MDAIRKKLEQELRSATARLRQIGGTDSLDELRPVGETGFADEVDIIQANEWREIEGKNPIDEEDGGEDYIRPANFVVAGEEPQEPAEPAPDPATRSRARSSSADRSRPERPRCPQLQTGSGTRAVGLNRSRYAAAS